MQKTNEYAVLQLYFLMFEKRNVLFLSSLPSTNGRIACLLFS